MEPPNSLSRIDSSDWTWDEKFFLVPLLFIKRQRNLFVEVWESSFKIAVKLTPVYRIFHIKCLHVGFLLFS